MNNYQIIKIAISLIAIFGIYIFYHYLSSILWVIVPQNNNPLKGLFLLITITVTIVGAISVTRIITYFLPVNGDELDYKSLKTLMTIYILFLVIIIDTIRIIISLSPYNPQEIGRLTMITLLCFMLMLIYGFPKFLIQRKPFVLFLRRFSTYSDRAVLDALLKSGLGQNSSRRLVMLRAPNTRIRDWDPTTIGITGIIGGLDFFSPLPIFIKSNPNNWKKIIEHLIKKSSIIIIDTSYHSNAVQYELELIKKLSAENKTIAIINSSNVDRPRQLSKRIKVIEYKTTWHTTPMKIFNRASIYSILSFSILAFSTKDTGTLESNFLVLFFISIVFGFIMAFLVGTFYQVNRGFRKEVNLEIESKDQ